VQEPSITSNFFKYLLQTDLDVSQISTENCIYVSSVLLDANDFGCAYRFFGGLVCGFSTYAGGEGRDLCVPQCKLAPPNHEHLQLPILNNSLPQLGASQTKELFSLFLRGHNVAHRATYGDYVSNVRFFPPHCLSSH